MTLAIIDLLEANKIRLEDERKKPFSKSVMNMIAGLEHIVKELQKKVDEEKRRCSQD